MHLDFVVQANQHQPRQKREHVLVLVFTNTIVGLHDNPPRPRRRMLRLLGTDNVRPQIRTDGVGALGKALEMRPKYMSVGRFVDGSGKKHTETLRVRHSLTIASKVSKVAVL